MITAEYIWLDGNSPAQLRSKTKVLPEDAAADLMPSGDLMAQAQNRQKVVHPIVCSSQLWLRPILLGEATTYSSFARFLMLI